jgi:hypothetical protein
MFPDKTEGREGASSSCWEQQRLRVGHGRDTAWNPIVTLNQLSGLEGLSIGVTILSGEEFWSSVEVMILLKFSPFSLSSIHLPI